jgi:hypothetical protein
MKQVTTRISIDKSASEIKRIKQEIGKALLEQWAEPGKFNKMKKFLHEFFVAKFLESPEYISLTTGTLRAEFGLDDKMVKNLKQLVQDFTKVRVNADGPYSSPLLSIYIGFESMDELQDLCDKYSYFSNDQYLINWLDWLLFKGTETVVIDYKVKYIDKKDAGRSGLAIMVGKKGSGYSYHVGDLNSHFAGTASSNWFNRTLQEHSKEFLEIIKETFPKAKKNK